ncbi:hypothetical protein A4G20_04540 [Pasteurellaceae bacterium RH1A]|nr:hypothetical protein A4G20_04540 [Pasteurellaceae bacterium RH1A]
MNWFSAWTAWLCAGFVLLILEAIIPGVFIMWWGLAALVVAGLSYLMPELALGSQAIIFALLAIAFSLVWWKIQHKKDLQADQTEPLNQRERALIGAKGTIVEILENGTARGKFGDTTWRVAGGSFALGDVVEVERVDGITLLVKKLA